MPSRTEHLNLAERTDATMKYLQAEIDTHLEWVVITAFYQAVHYIEALFALSDVHTKKHKIRAQELKARYPQLYRYLEKLRQHSNKARYLQDVKGCYAAHCSAATVKSELLGQNLFNLRIEVKKLIKEAEAA